MVSYKTASILGGHERSLEKHKVEKFKEGTKEMRGKKGRKTRSKDDGDDRKEKGSEEVRALETYQETTGATN